MRVIRQQTTTECGLACLAMVAGSFGHHRSVREWREQAGVGRDGTSLRTLAGLARGHGFTARAFRAEGAALDLLPTPMIVHWEQSHYVVVEKLTDTQARIVDPGIGRIRLSRLDFEESYSGVAMTLTPGEGFQRRRRARSGLGRFMGKYLPRDVAPILSLVAMSAVLVLIALAPAYLTRFVVDQVLVSSDGQLLKALLWFVGVFGISFVAATLARAELLLWLQTVMDNRMMSDFLSHLLSLPYKYFQTRRSGDLLVRAGSTAFIRDLLSGQLLAIFIDVTLIVVYLGGIARSSGTLALVLCAVALLQILIVVATLGRAKRLAQTELIALSEAQSTLLETVGGIESVKSAGAEDAAYTRWNDQFVTQLSASVTRRRQDNVVDSLLAGVRVVTPVLITLTGAGMVLQGQVSMGEMLAMSALAGAALAPIGTFGHSLQSLQTVGVHLDRVKDVLEEEPESVGQGSRQLDVTGAVRFRHVDFGYSPESANALSEISLDVPSGAKIAIVGPSGSGKSTLARTLTGLLAPTSGEVSFDGVPLRSLDLRYLRQQCGVVTQTPTIMSGDIRANVTIAHPEATDLEVWTALRCAALDKDIAALPLGLNTPLGDDGMGLSGGQLQRLALARALVHRPRILVLDEATSHLDSDTENSIFHNLNRLECTQIVVAHRLSTVKDADQIVVLEAGRIAGVGTHDELMGECDAYRHLIARQLPAA